MTDIKVREYNLPDAFLYKQDCTEIASKIWVPSETCVILGKSNKPTDSLIVKKVIEDNIPVYKRPSGGETVVLSNNMIIISSVVQHKNIQSGKPYFMFFNNKIIDILERLGVKNLHYRGISDIAIKDKKILGSAIYQHTFMAFYHAVLNVNESVELMDKYLKHPVREPDYRKNRNHLEFVTSLQNEGYGIDKHLLIHSIKKEFKVISFS